MKIFMSAYLHYSFQSTRSIMLSRTSTSVLNAVARRVPSSSRVTAVSVSRSFGTYSNQNAPETKSNVKQQVSDAKSGKSASRVSEDKSMKSGKVAGESGSSQGASKNPASSTSSSSENAINQPNSRPDDIRHDNDYNDKTAKK